MDTRFWMIRHALVEENARATLYGIMDVELCPRTLVAQAPTYQAIARRLPQPAQWVVTPLSRTRLTAEAIFRGGYPVQAPIVCPGLIEQNLGEWQALPHAQVVPLLTSPAHAFWPVSGNEQPPGGESFSEMIGRVGPAMDELAENATGPDIVVVSHGGTIRAAVAHAMGVGAEAALHLSVANLSLTRLEHSGAGWRVACVNEMSDFSYS